MDGGRVVTRSDAALSPRCGGGLGEASTGCRRLLRGSGAPEGTHPERNELDPPEPPRRFKKARIALSEPPAPRAAAGLQRLSYKHGEVF